MYAVIFRAEIKGLDEAYFEMASRMRDLAINKYGCVEFRAVTERNQEIAISYWNNQDQIKAWKNDPEHQKAQELGKSKWYKAYQVQITEIIRKY
ncbi:antibiotic biosynthesis monooxygenase family protein [Geopsychrobacter electrodiphilus]|uniref:antibiotic biosynthesis monooxygenase family protein n=1 Tax=Geopsychrobacter electrodiphilus TaxID=225196 RepID=UPI000363222C|nr:antibiotic biosynthesis monooxygenase [Geopsychrobacter electrodiphilus]